MDAGALASVAGAPIFADEEAPGEGIIVAAILAGTGLPGFVLYRKLCERLRVIRG